MSDDTGAPVPGGGGSLGWRQFVLPVIVLVVVFGWLLPKIIDYELVWESMRSLPTSAAIILLVVATGWTFIESGIYTSLIPGLRPFPGWKSFMGGNSIAGFAPAPWDMVARYGMYRTFGIEATPAGSSIIVGGMFTLGIKYIAPVIALVAAAATTDVSESFVTFTIVVAIVIGLIIAIVIGLLRAESWAAYAGRLIQKGADWLLPKIKRESDTDLEAWLLDFRLTVITSLSAGWQRPLFYVLTSHTIQFLGMLFIFRELGLGPDVIPFWDLAFTYCIGIFMSMVPIVPGGIGAVELTYVWILARDNEALADAVAAAAFTHRAFFWFIPIVIGIWPLTQWIRGGGSLTGMSEEAA